jgi:hypothetical protein
MSYGMCCELIHIDPNFRLGPSDGEEIKRQFAQMNYIITHQPRRRCRTPREQYIESSLSRKWLKFVKGWTGDKAGLVLY